MAGMKNKKNPFGGKQAMPFGKNIDSDGKKTDSKKSDGKKSNGIKMKNMSRFKSGM